MPDTGNIVQGLVDPMVNAHVPSMMGDFGVPWTPTNTTTTGWYDASDLSTITESGGLVSQWDDKSGNGYHLVQLSGSAQPTTGVETQNGLNVLDFDGGDALALSGFGVPLSGDISIYQVGIANVVNDSNDAFVTFNSGTDFSFESGGTMQFNGRLNNSGLGFSGTLFTGGPFSSYMLMSHVLDFTVGGDYHGYINGTQQATDSPYSGKLSSPNELRVMQARGGDRLEGEVAELVILEDVSTTTRQLIEGYLAHKWGLEANLPMGHPYKSAAPTV